MNRLDKELTDRELVQSRSQAENYIKLGVVKVNDKTIIKPGFLIAEADKITLASEQYVSRAALKLASIAKQFSLDFRGKTVLDVGSSTGGFTDFALQHGASKVIAVDVGTNQLHASLRGDKRVELHEKTDVRQIRLQRIEERSKENGESKDSGNKPLASHSVLLTSAPDIVLIDVSFISLRDVLPSIRNLCGSGTLVVAMVKPQFEVGKEQTNRGVIKNDKLRRQILQDFKTWVKKLFVIMDKADSKVTGAKGNLERFHLLKIKNP